jgi:hypothetical protein
MMENVVVISLNFYASTKLTIVILFFHLYNLSLYAIVGN